MQTMTRIVALIGAAALAGAVAAEPTFTGAEKCRPCHLPEFNSWSEAAHAGATADARGSADFQPSCLGCHATGGREDLEGVQCESCHGPGSEYWPIPVMMDVDKAVAAGLHIPSQETCNRCHDGQDHHAAVEFDPDFHEHRERRPLKDVD